MKIKNFAKVLFWGVLSADLAGCASNPKVDVLVPVGQPLDGPATVQFVTPEAQSTSKLAVGDKLVAIDTTPLPTFGDLLSKGAALKPIVYSFAKPTGEIFEVSANSVTDEKGQLKFSFVRPDDALVTTAPFISKPVPAGMTATEFGSAMVSMERWQGTPNLLEVQVTFAAGKSCTKCTLKSFGIVDLTRNSLLTIIPMDQAAWIEYPDAGQPGQYVNVPPPVPMGAMTTANITGTVNGTYNQFGSFGTYNGTVSAFGNATTTYNYDYSATNAANMQNLGVAIRNANIQAQNAARTKFINERYGNLRLGAFMPGETVTGHMFFAAPIGFEGPYAFVVMGESKASGVMFNVNSVSKAAVARK